MNYSLALIGILLYSVEEPMNSTEFRTEKCKPSNLIIQVDSGRHVFYPNFTATLSRLAIFQTSIIKFKKKSPRNDTFQKKNVFISLTKQASYSGCRSTVASFLRHLVNTISDKVCFKGFFNILRQIEMNSEIKIVQQLNDLSGVLQR